MKKKLTKRAVDALVPKVDSEGRRLTDFLWDTVLPGFGCKVTPKGTKVYIFQYRTRDQNSTTAPKRITLGRDGALELEDAREFASSLSLKARAGLDPADEWRKREAPTVSDLASRFLQEYLPRKKRPTRESTVEGYETILRCHVIPVLGSKLVEQVTTGDVERLHAQMRKIPYQANRTLAVLLQAFDHG